MTINNKETNNEEVLIVHENKPIENTRKLIKKLIEDKLITPFQANNIVTHKEIEIYMYELFKNWKITKNKYLEYFISSWIILLWDYLVHKWIISYEQKEEAYKKQLELNNSWIEQKFWEILINEKIIKDDTLKLLSQALEELWIIKLWEYFVWNWIITSSQLNLFLKVQKHKNLNLGQILVKFEIITQDELKIILKKLWINYKYFDIENEEWLYWLKDNKDDIIEENEWPRKIWYDL